MFHREGGGSNFIEKLQRIYVNKRYKKSNIVFNHDFVSIQYQ